MCQATAYLARDGQERPEEIMQDVILLETTADDVRLSTFFEEPQTVLRQELMVGQVGNLSIDYVTFSGMAEPTLAANLGKLEAVVRETLPRHPPRLS